MNILTINQLFTFLAFLCYVDGVVQLRKLHKNVQQYSFWGEIMKKQVAFLTLVVAATAIALTGCSKEEKTVAGVVVGAGLGAGIGAAAGGGTGAAIGAPVGAVAGGMVGYSMGDDEE
jgi:hypothetical protein